MVRELDRQRRVTGRQPRPRARRGSRTLRDRPHLRQRLGLCELAGRRRVDTEVRQPRHPAALLVDQDRQVGILVFFDGVEVAEFQFRHAAATFLFQDFDLHAIVLKHGDKIFHHFRMVVIAIAGNKNRDLAGSGPCSHGGAIGLKMPQ